MQASEAELDLVADGKNICIPAIMEHIEKTGVHSGDSLIDVTCTNLNRKGEDKNEGLCVKNCSKTGL